MDAYQVVGMLSEIDTEPESEDSMHMDSESDDMYSSCSDSDNDSNMDDNGSNASSSDEAGHIRHSGYSWQGKPERSCER